MSFLSLPSLLWVGTVFVSQSANAQNAEPCISYEAQNGIVKNSCNFDVQAFLCETASCGGSRYYGVWQHIQPNGKHKLMFPLKEPVTMGACPGTYFTATHSESRAYTCLDTKEIRAQSSVKLSRNKTPLQTYDDAKLERKWECTPSHSQRYTASRIGPWAVRIHKANGHLLTLNAFGTAHPKTGQPFIDPHDVHIFLCSEWPETSLTNQAIALFNKALKDMTEKYDKAQFTKKQSPCLCVRG